MAAWDVSAFNAAMGAGVRYDPELHFPFYNVTDFPNPVHNTENFWLWFLAPVVLLFNAITVGIGMYYMVTSGNNLNTLNSFTNEGVRHATKLMSNLLKSIRMVTTQGCEFQSTESYLTPNARRMYPSSSAHSTFSDDYENQYNSCDSISSMPRRHRPFPGLPLALRESESRSNNRTSNQYSESPSSHQSNKLSSFGSTLYKAGYGAQQVDSESDRSGSLVYEEPKEGDCSSGGEKERQGDSSQDEATMKQNSF